MKKILTLTLVTIFTVSCANHHVKKTPVEKEVRGPASSRSGQLRLDDDEIFLMSRPNGSLRCVEPGFEDQLKNGDSGVIVKGSKVSCLNFVHREGMQGPSAR